MEPIEAHRLSIADVHDVRLATTSQGRWEERACAAVAAVVVTENAKPFTRWAALLRRMGSKVTVREVSRADYRD